MVIANLLQELYRMFRRIASDSQHTLVHVDVIITDIGENKYMWNKEYWHFLLLDRVLSIHTPWFGLHVSDGGQEWLGKTMWWGFTIHWSRTKNPQMGDLYFQRSYTFKRRERDYRWMIYTNELEKWKAGFDV
jgi:hypothetical protein